MDTPLYDEMINADCWDGKIVFSARGYKYDLLPNPVFGFYPNDCEKKKSAIFFTPLSVSMMVQTTLDDASIVVEDSLDVISSILEHDIPIAPGPNSPTTKILEFRCLGTRFWFGNVETEETSFDPLASILSTYSPGISYEKFHPLNLGIETIQEKVTGGDFSGWTPPPPSETPPSFLSPNTVSTARRSSRSNSVSSSTSSGNNDSSSTNTSSSRSSSSSSSSSSSWGYSNVVGSSSNKKSSPTTKHKHFAGSRLELSPFANNNFGNNSNISSAAAASLDQETQFYASRNYLLSQEAEGRLRLISEEFVPETTNLISSGKSEFQKLLTKQLDAVQQVNLTTLDTRQSFLNHALEGIPQSYAQEEPTSEVVSDFINELEKSVRVRMSMYLMNGSGPQAIQQRQHAEAQTMYRALSDQLERLKAQNSQLAVQLAQERRHIDDIETELDTTKSELSKAKSREQAVLSRMRKREADWSASGASRGRAESALVVDMADQEHHM